MDKVCSLPTFGNGSCSFAQVRKDVLTGSSPALSVARNREQYET